MQLKALLTMMSTTLPHSHAYLNWLWMCPPAHTNVHVRDIREQWQPTVTHQSACTSTIKGRFYTTILSFSSAGQILETLGMRLESCTYTMWVSMANSGHDRISVHLIWVYQTLLYYVNYLISYWEHSYQQPSNLCFNPIHSIATTRAPKNTQKTIRI